MQIATRWASTPLNAQPYEIQNTLCCRVVALVPTFYKIKHLYRTVREKEIEHYVKYAIICIYFICKYIYKEISC